MEIRKFDTGDIQRARVAEPISLGHVDDELSPPEPLTAGLERRNGAAFLDGTRGRWAQLSSLGTDAPHSNTAMRGF